MCVHAYSGGICVCTHVCPCLWWLWYVCVCTRVFMPVVVVAMVLYVCAHIYVHACDGVVRVDTYVFMPMLVLCENTCMFMPVVVVCVCVGAHAHVYACVFMPVVVF